MRAGGAIQRLPSRARIIGCRRTRSGIGLLAGGSDQALPRRAAVAANRCRHRQRRQALGPAQCRSRGAQVAVDGRRAGGDGRRQALRARQGGACGAGVIRRCHTGHQVGAGRSRQRVIGRTAIGRRCRRCRDGRGQAVRALQHFTCRAGIIGCGGAGDRLHTGVAAHGISGRTNVIDRAGAGGTGDAIAVLQRPTGAGVGLGCRRLGCHKSLTQVLRAGDFRVGHRLGAVALFKLRWSRHDG